MVDLVLDEQRDAAAEVGVEQRIVSQRRDAQVRGQAGARRHDVSKADRPWWRQPVERHRLRCGRWRHCAALRCVGHSSSPFSTSTVRAGPAAEQMQSPKFRTSTAGRRRVADAAQPRLVERMSRASSVMPRSIRADQGWAQLMRMKRRCRRPSEKISPGMMLIPFSMARWYSVVPSTRPGSCTHNTVPPAGRVTRVPAGNTSSTAAAYRATWSATWCRRRRMYLG